MGQFAKVARETFEGNMFSALVRVLFGLFLSLLSFSAYQLYDRMDCAEKNIVALQITDAARSEKLIAIDAKLESIERKLDVLVGIAPR